MNVEVKRAGDRAAAIERNGAVILIAGAELEHVADKLALIADMCPCGDSMCTGCERSGDIADDASTEPDAVNHPSHYTSDPSGVECIQITRHRNFNVGNAIKYLWRAGLKTSEGREPLAKQIEDLEKARWYIADEIERLRDAQPNRSE